MGQMNVKGDGSVDHDSGLGTSKHKSLRSDVRRIDFVSVLLLWIIVIYLPVGHTVCGNVN